MRRVRGKCEVLAELEKIEAEDERAEKILLARKRYMGHMKFVGELFGVGLLSANIMHFCVKELLGNAHKPKGEKADLEEKPDEEKIQCLCTLMTTIGYKLEDAAIANKEKKPEQKVVPSKARYQCKYQ